MTLQTALKLGQVVGAIFLIVGVASCQLGDKATMPMWFLLGGVVYGGCRLAAWFAKKE